MQLYRNNLSLIIGQVVIFALFSWYFLQFSFLRPCANKWVDGIISLLLILTMAINFWIVFPWGSQKGTFFTYIIFSFIESLILNTLEYVLTYGTVTSIYGDIILSIGEAKVLLPIYCNTLLRDFALLVFVGLVADNIRLSKKQVDDDQGLLRAKNQLIVKNQGITCVIDMAPIYLCRQEKNYAILYSVDGQIYKKRISLKDLENLLKAQQFIRISKSDIIRLSSIKKCEDNLLILKDAVVTNTKAIAISKSFMENVIPTILQFLQNELESVSVPDSSLEEAQQQTAITEPEIPMLSPKAAIIQQYVSSHRDCKLAEIVSGTKIPKSTVARYLKELQQNGLIEYVGSKKTGGYRAVEKREM